MRVTRAIRDYVESEVARKFEPSYSAVRKPYNDRKEATLVELRKIQEEADRKAREVCKSAGFTVHDGSLVIRLIDYAFSDKDAWEAILKKEADLKTRQNQAVMDILISLELGETTKDQLRAALDAIEV